MTSYVTTQNKGLRTCSNESKIDDFILRSKLFLLGELASSSDSKPLGWQSCPRLLTHCRTCDASVLMFSRPTRFFWWPLLPGSHDLGIGDSRRNELTLLKKCREPFSQSSRTCLLLRWCCFSLSFLGSRGSFHHLQSVQPTKVQVCRNLILMVPENFPAEHSFRPSCKSEDKTWLR